MMNEPRYKTIIEPFRIHSVEPLRMSTTGQGRPEQHPRLPIVTVGLTVLVTQEHPGTQPGREASGLHQHQTPERQSDDPRQAGRSDSDQQHADAGREVRAGDQAP
jgi:hypothetical protein